MQVTSTTGVTSTTSTSTSTASSTATTQTLQYEQFLNLLITEMQNQDPTEPMDATQTVSQLASFSAVEQAVKTNATLSSILTASTLSQAGSLVGKTVTSADGATSGVVQSVTTSSSGLIATLADGTTMTLDTGITVSE